MWVWCCQKVCYGYSVTYSELTPTATKSLDISYPVEEYRRIVEDDPEVYNKEHMTTKIVHTRRYVFDLEAPIRLI